MQSPNEPSYPPPIPAPDSPTTNNFIPPPGPARVNLDVVGRAWEVLKSNLGLWVAAFLIYLVITFGISMLFSMLSGNDSRSTPNMPIMLIGNLIQFVIGQLLMGGLYRMAINQVRGGTPEFSDLFSVTDVLPALLIAAILTSLATFAGFLFCIIPGLLIASLLMFTIPLVVDKRMDAITAMTASIDALKPQMGMALVFTLVIGILAGAGALLCGVGLLITGPLALLSIALLYRDFFPEPSPI